MRRVLLLSLLVACSHDKPRHRFAPDLTASLTSDRIGLALYGKAQPTPGNLALSPLGVAPVLAMLWQGAGGQTASTMGQSLGFRDSTVSALGGVVKGDMPPGLALAVALWAARAQPVEPAYLARVQDTFGQAPELVTMNDDTRARMNEWFESRTGMKEIVASLDPMSTVVLGSAVRFVGTWKTPFEVERTQDAPFHMADQDVTVKMMSGQVEAMSARVDGVTVVELPFTEGLVFDAILPDDPATFAQHDAALPARLGTWLEALEVGDDVMVYMPRLDLMIDFPLRAALEGLGLGELFAAPDLSAMCQTCPGMRVTDAVHKVTIHLDEKGAVVAAATVVGVATTSAKPQPSEIRLDRPFFWVIRHRQSGLIVFLGRVVDPRQ
jgi:serine protease inhibitor